MKKIIMSSFLFFIIISTFTYATTIGQSDLPSIGISFGGAFFIIVLIAFLIFLMKEA